MQPAIQIGSTPETGVKLISKASVASLTGRSESFQSSFDSLVAVDLHAVTQTRAIPELLDASGSKVSLPIRSSKLASLAPQSGGSNWETESPRTSGADLLPRSIEQIKGESVAGDEIKALLSVEKSASQTAKQEDASAAFTPTDAPQDQPLLPLLNARPLPATPVTPLKSANRSVRLDTAERESMTRNTNKARLGERVVGATPGLSTSQQVICGPTNSALPPSFQSDQASASLPVPAKNPSDIQQRPARISEAQKAKIPVTDHVEMQDGGLSEDAGKPLLQLDAVPDGGSVVTRSEAASKDQASTQLVSIQIARSDHSSSKPSNRHEGITPSHRSAHAQLVADQDQQTAAAAELVVGAPAPVLIGNSVPQSAASFELGAAPVSENRNLLKVEVARSPRAAMTTDAQPTALPGGSKAKRELHEKTASREPVGEGVGSSAAVVADQQPVPPHQPELPIDRHHGVSTGAVSLVVPPTAANHVAARSSAISYPDEQLSPSARVTADVAPVMSDLRTLVATPNVLEVGVSSGTHGWVRVRAELEPTGSVAASVVAPSENAAQSLHKELPALNAYLSEERLGVGSLVVNAAGSASGGPDSAWGGSVGTGASNSQRGQQSGDSSASRQPLIGESGSRHTSVADELNHLAAGLERASGFNGSGGWVNVRV